jgi:hypothetical protein
MIPKRVQAAGGGGFSHCRGVEAFGAGEVDPAWASLYAALVVGEAAACCLPRYAARAALARPIRSKLPRGLQTQGPAALTGGPRRSWSTDPPYYDAVPYSDLADCRVSRRLDESRWTMSFGMKRKEPTA